MNVDPDNPYAPPASATGGFRVKGDPKSYWIEGDHLFVRDGASLPDVCLETGRVEGEMSRIHHVLRDSTPARIYLYLAFVLFFGVGVMKLLFVPWIIIAGYFVYLFLRRSIEANLCSSRAARTRQKGLEFAKWMVAIGVVAFVSLAPFDPVDRFCYGLTIGLLGRFLLFRLDQSFRVVKIKDRVAVLSGVHPEALIQLNRWRRARLSRYLPKEIGQADEPEGS